ncbi:MAG: nucleoside recognition domain-containing protein [Verrucomicrobiales bacterium]|nr:nucleoside recognition domain-containing protein [Verrucomicrobiales bacterium]
MITSLDHLIPFRPAANRTEQPIVLALGLESVGKTQLLSRLSGRHATPENFRGSTLACESYAGNESTWADTPGIYLDSETETTRTTLNALTTTDQVMLVVRADRAAADLETLLPLVEGKPGFLVFTFADRLESDRESQEMKRDVAETLGVPVFLIDARDFGDETATEMRKTALRTSPASFHSADLTGIASRYPARTTAATLVEKLIRHPLAALVLLLLPAGIAVTQANRFADWLFDPVASLIAPLQSWVEKGPDFIAALFAGDYGLVSMFPFLLLYAVPTILVFSVILAFYKSTGLIDRISVALHPWLRPFGVGGRDLVRVVMGFGCNVPAIVASRACTSCSRGACVSAISFGSACSYQLPATLAVFAAAGLAGLGMVYIAVLALTTLIYLRFTTPKALRLATNALLLPESDPLHAPSWRSMMREVLGNLHQFVIMALPVFIGICFAAATLAYLGVLDWFAKALSPVMALFGLPGEAATAVVLGSIRKDGLAIGLLDSDRGALKVGLETPAQVLTAVYLAGVLLPCLVTLYTIGREMRWAFAAKLCLRQMAWAAGFSLVIAWVGAVFF